MATGVCRNGPCANARSATPVELYSGPGRYCPECGEPLEPLAAAQSASTTTTTAAPFGGLTALEALAQFDAGAAPPEQPVPPRPSRTRKRVAFVAASVAVVAVAAGALLRPSAAERPATAHRPSAAHRFAASHVVRVCDSSLTERFAADVVRAYADKARLAPSHFELARGGPCDVRFAAPQAAASGAVLGRDGVVVVLNPQNPLTRLTRDDVRLIFSGAITDWSEFGEPPGRIVAIAPADATDEAQALARTLLAHQPIGRNVRRLASSADVVRAVVSASGRGTIGLVAFSAAVPAKVIAVAPLPAPSSLSIGDGRYTPSVALTVDSAARTGVAAELTAYARSEDAQAIVSRDGFVPKKGL